MQAQAFLVGSRFLFRHGLGRRPEELQHSTVFHLLHTVCENAAFLSKEEERQCSAVILDTKRLSNLNVCPRRAVAERWSLRRILEAPISCARICSSTARWAFSVKIKITRILEYKRSYGETAQPKTVALAKIEKVAYQSSLSNLARCYRSTYIYEETFESLHQKNSMEGFFNLHAVPWQKGLPD